MKKITIMLTALSLLFSLAVGAHAIESPDPDRNGSLTLVMEREGQKLSTGTLTICRVGQIVFEEDVWKFTLLPQLQDSDVSLEDLNDAQLPKQLEQLAKEKALPCITAPIQDGKAVFADLETGLYLVIQEEASQGLSPINPFLISLPRWEDNRYVYDLVAQPKVSPEPLPTLPPETPETDPTKPTDPKLPQTGQLNWPVPVMTMAGLALFSLGWYLCFGKKNGYEK